MNRSYRRTRLRLLAGVSGAVTLSLLAVAGCSSSSSSSAPATSSSAAASSSSSASAAVVPLVVYSAQGYDFELEGAGRIKPGLTAD
jgi:hypothetical protein